MPSVDAARIDEMREAVFFDGPEGTRATTRFWILLVLAAVIAGAGVIGDSTATVIGAMIIAPLMIPIQGTMLATVLGDRANLVRSAGLVATAALAATAIGFALASLAPNDIEAATNSQVAARVNPTLVDLVAALATGAVGSIALCRRDISDTLPGVAIAISLVPPLSVVGITLEAGELGQAWGALLLFITNVTAILVVGSVMMAVYRVRAAAMAATGQVEVRRRRSSPIVIAAMLVLVAIPLTTSTVFLVRQRAQENEVLSATRDWARGNGWDVVTVNTREGKTVVRLTGSLPTPETASLRGILLRRGVDIDAVRVELIPSESVEFDDEGTG